MNLLFQTMEFDYASLCLIMDIVKSVFDLAVKMLSQIQVRSERKGESYQRIHASSERSDDIAYSKLLNHILLTRCL